MCSLLAKPRTYRKLSWIVLDRMKALWAVETIEFMNGLSRMARIFVIILTTPCIKLIGLKSLIVSAPSFLGIRIIFAELMMSR